jgi:hypothetical protein
MEANDAFERPVCGRITRRKGRPSRAQVPHQRLQAARHIAQGLPDVLLEVGKTGFPVFEAAERLAGSGAEIPQGRRLRFELPE